MELTTLILLTSFLTTASVGLYIIINLLIRIFGIYTREFSTKADATNTLIIIKHIKKTFIFSLSTQYINGEISPSGIIIGKEYLAYVKTDDIVKRNDIVTGYIITIWSRCEYLESLSGDIENGIENEIDDQTNSNMITLWRHTGYFKDSSYESFDVRFGLDSFIEQEQIINIIIEMANSSDLNGYGWRLSVIISGPPGSGKTEIGKLLTHKIKGTLCDDFRPTQAGENFSSLIKIIKPTKKKPLILVLDEWDTAINSIHNKSIKEHEFLVTPVTDKCTYNQFMDRLCELDNTIVLFTMNSKFEDIDKLDKSYTRCGRIDCKITFEKNNVSVLPFEDIGIASFNFSKRFKKDTTIQFPVEMFSKTETSVIKKDI